MLIADGFQCRGLDLSRDMVAYYQKLGLPVSHGNLTALGTARVSALVLCAVFEHLVNPEAWLKHASQVIEMNGLLVTLQPTASFANLMGRLLRLGSVSTPLPALHQVFCPPWHTVLFSLEGMKTLASRYGFKLLEIRPAPQGRSRGLLGLAQVCLESINRVGWHVAGVRWPFLISHVFVFRKI